MRSFSIFGLVALALSSIAAAITRAVAYGLSLFEPAPMRFAGTPALALSTGGQSLDPALRQSLRHEANVSRRSADRHI